ncbi:MAG TPA: peroxiredoxin-like family protein [Pseudonocardia sp.]|jgi:peroxiredoxin|nr:peroxiredoxin-like family protein [Pseudonocardia sp.]
MTLQEQLDSFKADFSSGKPPFNVPAHVYAQMEKATQELIDSGAAGRALKVGDQAPEFTLTDSAGDPVSSAALLARGPLIVSFYRGVWCPYCNLDLQALQAALPSFEELGASLVAISPQTPVNSRRSAKQNELRFPILSDPGNGIGAAFGLRFTLPDYLIDIYRANQIDLAAFNQDDSGTLSMPARFVISQDGVIRYAEVNPDYTQRPEPEEVLPELKRWAPATR